ncbi:MAG: hypothetical protein RQ751_10805 [Longimicrobiales bacterium]|nr:hypothetical protein [Longimicrobiales bacterium]
MAAIDINGKTYEHNFFRGKVVGASKQLETKVSGGGGGGYSHRGTGYTAPVHIQSTTTTHDMIHLADEEEHEHALRLQNWDLTVRETHLLTAVWLIKQGRKAGNYVAIHNHTLGHTDYDHRHLAKLHRSTWILLVSLAVVLLPLSGGLKTVLVLGGLTTWWVLGILGARKLIASGELLRLAGV